MSGYTIFKDIQKLQKVIKEREQFHYKFGSDCAIKHNIAIISICQTKSNFAYMDVMLYNIVFVYD